MALPVTFGSLSSGNQPASLFDTQFAAVAALGIQQCTATGTNAIALTPITNMPTITAYANYQAFMFVAANSSTGSVTVNYNGVGAISLYLQDGATIAGNKAIIAGATYIVMFNLALNSGAGGFQLMTMPGSPVTAGSYTNASLTVDVLGRVLAASNGSTPSSGIIKSQFFTSSGTFTTSASISTSTAFVIIGTGGGGGGGAGAGPSTTGGGGGAGATNIAIVTGLSPSTGYTVTIGAGGAAVAGGNGNTGGTTSIVIGATTYSAAGGTGGFQTSNSSGPGVGGTATNGALNIRGGSGQGGGSAANVSMGKGGGSFWGDGPAASQLGGTTANVYGTGGSGGTPAVDTAGNGFVGVMWLLWTE